MTIEQIESTTIQNALAIEKLTTISERTSKDVDKIVRHLDNILPVMEELKSYEERIDRIEKEQIGFVRSSTVRIFLMLFFTYIVSFGVYVENKITIQEKNFSSHVEKSTTILNQIEKRLEKMEIKIDKNMENR